MIFGRQIGGVKLNFSLRNAHFSAPHLPLLIIVAQSLTVDGLRCSLQSPPLYLNFRPYQLGSYNLLIVTKNGESVK